jgi:hypothetical protein
VIAIENARLLRELRQRTDDLSEALVYQTGSSNILKVIASSPTDVGPALKAIVDSACEICDAYDAAVVLKDGRDLRSPLIMGRSCLASRKRRSTGIGSSAAPWPTRLRNMSTTSLARRAMIFQKHAI